MKNSIWNWGDGVYCIKDNLTDLTYTKKYTLLQMGTPGGIYIKNNSDVICCYDYSYFTQDIAFIRKIKINKLNSKVK